MSKKLFAALYAGTLSAMCCLSAATAAEAGKKPSLKELMRMRQAAPQTVEVESAVLRPDLPVKRYVGHIRAIGNVKIRARISGNILNQTFKEGDYVKAGQLLYEIEDTTYRAQALAVAAQVRQNEAELVYAKGDFARKKNLFDKKAVSELVFDEATRLLHASEAKLAAAKANKLDADNSLSYTRIHTPIAGRACKATYSPGNYVTPASEALVSIVQITPIYVRFAISERDFLKLFKGVDDMRRSAEASLVLADGTPYPHKGWIKLADAQVDSATGTIKVWAVFENPDNRLVPGGYATVGLRRKDAPQKAAVKLSALQTDRRGAYVYVLDSGNRAVRRDIVRGHVISPWQLVESGLKPGEKVISDGAHKVRPGMTVIPMASTAPKPLAN